MKDQLITPLLTHPIHNSLSLFPMQHEAAKKLYSQREIIHSLGQIVETSPRTCRPLPGTFYVSSFSRILRLCFPLTGTKVSHVNSKFSSSISHLEQKLSLKWYQQGQCHTTAFVDIINLFVLRQWWLSDGQNDKLFPSTEMALNCKPWVLSMAGGPSQTSMDDLKEVCWAHKPMQHAPWPSKVSTNRKQTEYKEKLELLLVCSSILIPS